MKIQQYFTSFTPFSTNLYKKMHYKVLDSYHHLVRVFNTYKEALIFKTVCGNAGWYIKT